MKKFSIIASLLLTFSCMELQENKSKEVQIDLRQPSSQEPGPNCNLVSSSFETTPANLEFAPGEKFEFLVKLTNNNSVECEGTTFTYKVSDNQPALSVLEFKEQEGHQVVLAPGETKTVYAIYGKVSESAQEGNYGIYYKINTSFGGITNNSAHINFEVKLPQAAPDHDFSACNLNTTKDLPSIPEYAFPSYLGSYTDQITGAHVTRITDSVDQPMLNIPGRLWRENARHRYSLESVWNSDESMMVLKKRVSGQLFLDGNNYEPLFHRSFDGWTRWHATQPNTMVYLKESCELGHWNVVTNQTTVLADVSGSLNDCEIGGKGNTSDDSRYFAFFGKDKINNNEMAYLVDLQTGSVVTNFHPESFGIEIRDVVTSPTGAYIAVTGTNFNTGNSDTKMIFNQAGQPVQIWGEKGLPSHADMVRINGVTHYVGMSKTLPDPNNSNAGKWEMVMRSFANAYVARVNTLGASHTTARNFARPGWVYGTTDDYKRVAAYKLDGSQDIQNFAYFPNNKEDNYEAEAHGVPSPSGTRVVFASNWGQGSVFTFVADIRGLCPQN